jgi:hypothetical protein
MTRVPVSARKAVRLDGFGNWVGSNAQSPWTFPWDPPISTTKTSTGIARCRIPTIASTTSAWVRYTFFECQYPRSESGRGLVRPMIAVYCRCRVSKREAPRSVRFGTMTTKSSWKAAVAHHTVAFAPKYAPPNDGTFHKKPACTVWFVTIRCHGRQFAIPPSFDWHCSKSISMPLRLKGWPRYVGYDHVGTPCPIPKIASEGDASNAIAKAAD